MTFRDKTFSVTVRNALRLEIFDKLSAAEGLPINPDLLQQLLVHKGLQWAVKMQNQQSSGKRRVRLTLVGTSLLTTAA